MGVRAMAAARQVFRQNVLLCLDEARRADDLACGVHIAVLPHVHHGGPACGDDAPRPGARHGGRGIDAPLPVGRHKVLVVAVLLVTVQDDGGAFGGVAILGGRKEGGKKERK